jgi:ketosteroid isomerase-like protein
VVEAGDDASIRGWLDAWGDLVASSDIDAARALFADDVIGYGTRANEAIGLDRLVSDQWSKVWPAISGFRFDVEGAVVWVSPDRRLAVIAATWTSQGRRPDALVGQRDGRATVVLRRDGVAERWTGVHTHFSLVPDKSR